MSFRDDGEALRNRVANLEAELVERDADRKENEALRDRVRELEVAEGKRVGSPADVTSPRRDAREFPDPLRAGGWPTDIKRPAAGGGGFGRWLAWWIFIVWITFALLVGGPSCIAPEAKAIGWVACPARYITADVRHYDHNGGNHWCISCTMPDGTATDANETLENAASVGFAALVLVCGGLTHFASRLRRRRK